MHICKKGKMQAGPKVRFVVDNMGIKVSFGVLTLDQDLERPLAGGKKKLFACVAF